MTDLPQPIRTRVRRLYVPNAIYFITANVQGRKPLFAHDQNVERLRQTIRQAKQYHPFEMRAFAFMPDHMHLLMFVPDTTEIDKLMHSLKRNFTRNYKLAQSISGSLHLWQRSFYDHVIQDERDYLNHIHYNPVKHGYVARPEEYPHTSFKEHVKRGWYEVGWEQADAGWMNLYDEP